ncbi:alpha-amylase family glycosyl hydrolase [Streptomyces sp. NPDC127044]
MTVIYEINTLVWLRELGHRYGRPVALGNVPGEVWDEVARPGVDTVWLMGVWERSPAGLGIALRDDRLLASFRDALPDLTPADIAGSPYCVRDYVVDESLGGPEGLAAARAELAARGVRLILDYVPNHVAPDHPWLTERPDRLVRGTPDELARAPEAFLEAGGQVYARGRDPYFPPWPDVVQLNAFSDDLRAATVDTLAAIGDQADGVRCDMAMLLMNDVFAKTWGDQAGTSPAEDFWPYVIRKVRERHPDLLFVAEAYWDLEWDLQQQGFDHCYDKRLYDRLLTAAAPVREGAWELLTCTGWPDNDTHHNLLAWSWTGGQGRYLVVINYSDRPAEGRLPLPWTDLHGQSCKLTELLAGNLYEREGDELVDPGLFVALDAWHWHLLSLGR